MKYAITGHTKGIGQALYEKLSPNAVGFSKSTGFDIKSKESREQIIKLSEDCKVFVNSAYDDDGQVKLLYELFDSWKDEDKIIVNIGSETTSGIKSHAHSYSAYKAALDKASEQLSFLNKSCKVMNIKFGWVGTERIINLANPKSFIRVEDACDIILDSIRMSKHYRLTDLLIRPN
jgi:hypothetical protein